MHALLLALTMISAPDEEPGQPRVEAFEVPEETEAQPIVRGPRWYGWQNMLVLGGSAAVFVAGGVAQSSGAMAAGVTGYVVGGPVVHLAHENYKGSLTSFLLNTGAPISLGLLGAVIGMFFGPAIQDEGCHDFDCSGLKGLGAGLTVGFTIGAVAAPLIDIALLAYEEP